MSKQLTIALKFSLVKAQLQIIKFAKIKALLLPCSEHAKLIFMSHYIVGMNYKIKYHPRFSSTLPNESERIVCYLVLLLHISYTVSLQFFVRIVPAVNYFSENHYFAGEIDNGELACFVTINFVFIPIFKARELNVVRVGVRLFNSLNSL
jgi:hypothetical protein